MKVVWSKIAIAQLKNISYNQPSSITKKLNEKIVERTDILPEFPEIGTPQNFTTTNKVYKKHKYRYLVEGNYKIIYYLIKNDIRIAIVFDTRQEPQKLNALLNDELKSSNQ